jgi:hypothetical protein
LLLGRGWIISACMLSEIYNLCPKLTLLSTSNIPTNFNGNVEKTAITTATLLDILSCNILN